MADQDAEERIPQLNLFSEAEYLYHSGEIKKSQLYYQNTLVESLTVIVAILP